MLHQKPHFLAANNDERFLASKYASSTGRKHVVTNNIYRGLLCTFQIYDDHKSARNESVVETDVRIMSA